MKTINLIGKIIPVLQSEKSITVAGNRAVDKICFSLDRYVENKDLSKLFCIIKTENSKGEKDIGYTETVVQDSKILVIWELTGYIASVNGKIKVQIEFNEPSETEIERIVWQSEIAEFIIEKTIDCTPVIAENPTIIEQFENKVKKIQADINKKYIAVSDNINTINEMKKKLDHMFDTVLPSIKGDAISVGGRKVDDTKTDNKSLWTAEKTLKEIQIVKDIAEKTTEKTVFYRADARYSDNTHSLSIENMPKLLPETFSVLFLPENDYKYGDKLKITGLPNLINIYDKGFENNRELFSSFSGINTGNGYTIINANGTHRFIRTQPNSAAEKLKPNTQYTIIADIKEFSANGELWLSINDGTTSANRETAFVEHCSVQSGTTGIIKFLVTTRSELTTQCLLRYVLHKAATEGSVEFRSMLLEGDWTKKDIPVKYWENMRQKDMAIIPIYRANYG